MDRPAWLAVHLLVGVVLLGCSSDSTTPGRLDRVEATVGPAGATVVTPSGAAGVQIPPGAFSQPVVVTITDRPTPGTPGTGPLPTNLKQYPPFYEFTTSPANALFGDSVRVGVCQVTDQSSPFYAPEADHPRLKLAHTVGNTVEILQRVSVNDFLRCVGITASNRSSDPGWRGKLASVFAHAGVARAYAAHGGLGGKVKSFSPFGAVVDACGDTATLVVGATFNGAIEASDCTGPSGDVRDLFRVTLTSQQSVRITTTGPSGATVGARANRNLSEEEDIIYEREVGSTNYFIAPAGSYLLGIFGAPSGARGAYTVALQSVIIDGCTTGNVPTGPAVFLKADVLVTGVLGGSDCRTPTNPSAFIDHYETHMVAGARYEIVAAANGMLIEVGRPDGLGGLTGIVTASNPTGTASMIFQAPTSGIFIINAIAIPPGRSGGYTLTYTKLP